MTPLDLAQQYMDIVFSGGDLGRLSTILSDDCRFSGPLYQFDSAQAYIDSLKAHPPEDFEYKIIQAFERDAAACIVYQFSKPGITTPMAQLFGTRNGKINNILLVFDTAAFSSR